MIIGGDFDRYFKFRTDTFYAIKLKKNKCFRTINLATSYVDKARRTYKSNYFSGNISDHGPWIFCQKQKLLS